MIMGLESNYIYLPTYLHASGPILSFHTLEETLNFLFGQKAKVFWARPKPLFLRNILSSKADFLTMGRL